MDTPSVKSPHDLLLHLEESSIGERAISLEQQYAEVWRGFVFSLGDLDVIVPFDGGYEILPCGELISLPLAQSWARGMINIRGEIYTVADLSGYLGLEPVRNFREANLLLMPDATLQCALLLDSKISLRSFSQDLPQGVADDVQFPRPDLLLAVVFSEDRMHKWAVLNLPSLLQESRFRNIGPGDGATA
ncbi:MAG: chemotaxis protein CheW [Pseudomonadota bacterium]